MATAEAAGQAHIAQVVVEVGPAHLDRPFDYLVPEGLQVRVGQRVRVSFGGRVRPAWVVGLASESETDPERLRWIDAVDGPWDWFDEGNLRLYRWVAARYGSTVGAVLRHAIPARVAAVDREAESWPEPPSWTPAERPPCPRRAWRPYGASRMLKAVAAPPPLDVDGEREAGMQPAFWWRALPGDDRAAMAADLVARCLAAGRSALVLSADPHAPLARLALQVAGVLGADLRRTEGRDRGDESEARTRYRAALRCRTGHARVAVGGRSGVFAPLRDLGLVLLDDEANPAFKERRAPRHHAREVALARARFAGATAVLTGDLPSAALWRLLEGGHIGQVAADRATQRERAPRVDIVDLGDPRPGTRRTRFAGAASRALGAVMRDGGAAVVLTARRGEGTALACKTCGRRRACPVCDGGLRAQRDQQEAWECATCGWHGAADPCPNCGGTGYAPLAAGAGRLARELERSYPQAEVVRMEGFDAPGPTRRPAIAVMTRGSVVTAPAWLGQERAGVVVVPDADALLGRPSLDAGEDALRLWFAAAHWGDHLVVQTREPRHPAVQALVRWDPEGFWRREAERRAELAWPPHSSLVRLSTPAAAAGEVGSAVRSAVPLGDVVLGPDLGGHLLVKSRNLRGTLEALTPLRHDWGRRSVPVRVDVDPV